MTSLFRFFVLIFCVNFLLDACKTQEVVPLACAKSQDPAADFAWLKRKIDAQNRHNLDTVSISWYRYKNQDVFYETTLPLPLTYGQIRRQVLNCDGASISDNWLTDYDYRLFFAQAIFQKVVWKKGKTTPNTETVCGSNDPLKDFRFLSRAVDFITLLGNKRAAIYLYEYQAKPHFFAVSKPDLAGGRSDFAVFDCNGLNLAFEASWDQSAFLEKAKIQRLIWPLP